MPARRRRSAGLGHQRQPSRNLARGATDFSPDDGVRGELGVIASLVKRPDGTVRIVFDDARRGLGGTWNPSGIITSRDYPADVLRDTRIAPDELEQIGLAVIARLIASAQVARGE